jgi:hypothetical protein
LTRAEEADNLRPELCADEDQHGGREKDREHLQRPQAAGVLNEHDEATSLEIASSLPNDSPDAINTFDQYERSNCSRGQEIRRPNFAYVTLVRGLAGRLGCTRTDSRPKAKVGPQSAAAEGTGDISGRRGGRSGGLREARSWRASRERISAKTIGRARCQRQRMSFIGLGTKSRCPPTQSDATETNKLGIPIALLVNHSMAGSRLAMRQARECE